VSPVRYELGFYIPEDDILHSHGSLQSHTLQLSFILAYACHLRSRWCHGRLLKVWATRFSESSVDFPRATWRYIPEGHLNSGTACRRSSHKGMLIVLKEL
jgi:hypothetical protein